MLDAQMRQACPWAGRRHDPRGAPDLRRLTAIHLAASFGRVKVMTSAIGIQAQRQAVPPEYFQQRPERRMSAIQIAFRGALASVTEPGRRAARSLMEAADLSDQAKHEVDLAAQT